MGKSKDLKVDKRRWDQGAERIVKRHERGQYLVELKEEIQRAMRREFYRGLASGMMAGM